MMCALFNFVRTTATFYRAESTISKEPLYLSIVMFISCALSTPMDFFLVNAGIPSLFLPFGVYIFLDLLTIILLIQFRGVTTYKGKVCRSYLIIGLSINTCLFVAMQIEALAIYYGIQDGQPWWLWSIYGYGVNIIYVLMVCVLLIQKDFMWLGEAKASLAERKRRFEQYH